MAEMDNDITSAREEHTAPSLIEANLNQTEQF